MSTSAKTSTRGRLTVAILVLAGLALGYIVVAETVGAILVPHDPDLALMVRPADGEALIARAESQASEALTDPEIKTARKSAASALVRSPISVAALRTLAEVDQLEGDVPQAQRLMSLAGDRNLRDSKVRLWLFRESLGASRYQDAYLQADLLLRRHGELSATLYPALVGNLDAPKARDALLALMRSGPPWRKDFLNYLGQVGDPAGVAPWLLLNLASSTHPPDQAEIGHVASALAAQGRWAQVRDIWTRFGGGGFLYDGDFQAPPRDPPFGWRLSARDGDLAAIEAVDGGANRALFAQFPVGRNAVLAEMLLVLPPGQYRFSGRGKVEQLPSDAAFQWDVVCVEKPGSIATARATRVSGWSDFRVDFGVTAEGCEAQWLRLSGVGGEGYLPATGWFDGLKIQALR